MNRVREGLVGIMVTVMLLSSLPAQAGIVGTEQMLEQDRGTQSLDTVRSFIATEQVAAQLETWGVAPELVADRVAALSESELQQLAMTIESQPAGGGALVVVGIVFVVLLILELIGVTNIFNAI